MSWFPRFGVQSASTVGLDDANDPSIVDFEGRTLVIQWRRFVVEILLGSRP